MQRLLPIVLCLLAYTTAQECGLASNYQSNSLELYKNVVEGCYDRAVNITKTLYSTEEEAIRQVIQLLSKTGVKNIINYGYKLWVAGEQQIIKEYFPRPYKLLFNEDKIEIVNRRFEQPLTLKRAADSSGKIDTWAWGDSTENNYYTTLPWIFYPTFKNNKVLFKIKNLRLDMFLKLNSPLVDGGYRKASGSGMEYVPDDQILWNLEPFQHDGQIYFYIIDEKFSFTLRLQIDPNHKSSNDRQAWGYPEHYKGDTKGEWYLREFLCTYKFNQENV